MVNEAQVDRCVRFVSETECITNYEMRMGAEIKLYWIIYCKCCGSSINLSECKLALEEWKGDWITLFGQHEQILKGPSY